MCKKKRILQMERVLKAVPADLRVKMEALVHDLTLALEESSNSANVRRRWGIRRRARSTGNILTIMSTTLGGKKRMFRNDCKNRYGAIWCGKRKRSCRERSTDCEMIALKSNRTTKSKNRIKMQGEDTLDCSHISSSSISSSDSEAGLITNDEDREGDDEQSDWIGESSWWDDVESTNEDKVTTDPAFQMLLHGNFEHVVDESRKSYRQRVQRIREGLSGREIRAGRRHVDNKPGYSIITSANEKARQFIQLEYERFSDYKRLRKTPPNSPNPDSMMHTQEHPICSTSFRPQIISDSQNISTIQAMTKFPHCEWDSNSMDIEVHTKPKYHDFGHSKSS
ncbi:hypothetical protein KM043_006054 [Ampulex compressa]|nr:hypothetical protein KM043_006054 [Ampulex compressa]